MKPEYITVFYVSKPEELKEPVGMKRWKLIVEHADKDGHRVLNWHYTYSPRLAELGTKLVTFYQDNSNRACIRVPRKD